MCCWIDIQSLIMSRYLFGLLQSTYSGSGKRTVQLNPTSFNGRAKHQNRSTSKEVTITMFTTVLGVADDLLTPEFLIKVIQVHSDKRDNSRWGTTLAEGSRSLRDTSIPIDKHSDTLVSKINKSTWTFLSYPLWTCCPRTSLSASSTSDVAPQRYLSE